MDVPNASNASQLLNFSLAKSTTLFGMLSPKNTLIHIKYSQTTTQITKLNPKLT